MNHGISKSSFFTMAANHSRHAMWLREMNIGVFFKAIIRLRPLWGGNASTHDSMHVGSIRGKLSERGYKNRHKNFNQIHKRVFVFGHVGSASDIKIFISVCAAGY